MRAADAASSARPGALAKLARTARTLRHLRPVQALAQLRHAVSPEVRPVAAPGSPPALAVATGRVSFLPAPPHARWAPDGHLELVGLRARLDLAAHDWHAAPCGPLFAYQMHFGEYLRDPAVTPERRRAWMLHWIEHCRGGVGWDPHPLSVRSMIWGKLLLEADALALSAEDERRVLRSLAEQVETLSRHFEHRLQANHLLHNRISVCFGALLLAGSNSARWLRGVPALLAEIDAQFGGDGAHIERSPMYHSILLEALLDLLTLADARAEQGHPLARELAGFVRERCAALCGALRAWMHPDGEIALFADSAFGLAHPPDVLLRRAAQLGVGERAPSPPGLLRNAGYARLEAGPFALIASVSGPRPAHQPGHAHADALSFELSVGPQRVVTDTGVCEYVPGPRRDTARATRSHATVEVGGYDQAELWAAHRIGGRPRVEVTALDLPHSLEATCRGWATPDTLHRRLFEVRPDALTITDRFEGRERPLRFALPLAPGLRVQLEAGRAVIGLEGGAGRALVIELPVFGVQAGGTRGAKTGRADAAWRIEARPYYARFGSAQPRDVLVARPEAVDGPARFRMRVT